MEHDVWYGEANIRQSDAEMFHTWEIAGTSHVDHHMRQSREPLEFATSENLPRQGSPRPAASRQWAPAFRCSTFSPAPSTSRTVGGDSTPPPPAPAITLSTIGTPNVVARDNAGLALGGIRLADARTTALNIGTSTGPGACDRWGYYKPFDIEKLNKLYPNHQAYVSAVERVTNENLKAGFILKSDADHTIQEARDSAIGRLDSIEAERDRRRPTSMGPLNGVNRRSSSPVAAIQCCRRA